MSNAVRFQYVNVVPTPKIKIEISDDDELLPCSMCCKEFASATALKNHGRSEHIDTFIKCPEMFEMSQTSETETTQSGTPTPVQQAIQLKPPKEGPKKQLMVLSSYSELKKEIKKREQAILSSMKPSNLQELASTDVEYIIVKAEKEDIAKTKKRKVASDEEGVSGSSSKNAKVLDPITGPFECLQPSNLVADGVCHQIFFSCCEYSAHFRDEHTRRRKGNRCQVCEKPLLSGEGLDAPYNCLVCGAGFISNKDLNNHTATNHVKLKPFECSVCHKRFTQQGGVQQHMRMHTGVRPFSCTFCPKAFTQKSGLDQHLRIHTKVKPYRCVICSKTFCQSIHLKQHMRTHTNVSPFECGICAKRFKQSSHLNYHLKNHNLLAMSAEQREKYDQLMKEIIKGDEEKEKRQEGRDVVRRKQKKVVVLTQENGELVTIDHDELQGYVVTEGEVPIEQEIEEVETVSGDDEQQSEQDQQEQILAEQSITIEVDQETYILGDVGEETWEEELSDGGEGATE